MNYTVKYLDNFTYDNLPFKEVKESLGCADPKNRIAYVRRTGIRPLDMFVADHEIEELINKYSTHEDEDGIRYKKGGAARNILPTIFGTALGSVFGMPWLGAAIGAASNVGMQQYAQAGHPEQLGKPGQIGNILTQGLVGGLGGYGGTTLATGAIKGATAAGTNPATSGLLGRIAGGAKGALGFSPAVSGGTTGATTGLGKEFATQQASQFGTPLSQTSANFGNQLVTGGVNRGLTATTGALAGAIPFASSLGFQPQTGPSAAAPQGTYNATNIPTTPGAYNVNDIPASPFAQGTPGANLGEVSTQTPTSSPLKDLLKNLGIDTKTMVGAAIPMVGQFFSPGPQAFSPQESALFNEVSDRVKLGTQVQLTPAQSQAITAQYDQVLKDARQNIMDRYKALRPGSDIENDSQFREAMLELEGDIAEKKANALAGAQMGLSQQQTSMMSELAAMDIYTLSMKAGISAQESAQFKQLLAQLGFMVAQGGQPTGGRVISINY